MQSRENTSGCVNTSEVKTFSSSISALSIQRSQPYVVAYSDYDTAYVYNICDNSEVGKTVSTGTSESVWMYYILLNACVNRIRNS